MDDYLMAWNSHDINKILSFFTDDGIYEDVAHGIVNHGKKEITGYLKTSFIDFPDLKVEVKTIVANGEWIVFEIVTSGTHAHSSMPEVQATGKTFSIRAVSVFKMSKGKISRQSEYYNYATLLQLKLVVFSDRIEIRCEIPIEPDKSISVILPLGL
jgi:steroid delta-isomerase-like uncharacterized protein